MFVGGRVILLPDGYMSYMSFPLSFPLRSPHWRSTIALIYLYSRLWSLCITQPNSCSTRDIVFVFLPTRAGGDPTSLLQILMHQPGKSTSWIFVGVVFPGKNGGLSFQTALSHNRGFAARGGFLWFPFKTTTKEVPNGTRDSQSKSTIQNCL